MKSEHPEVVVGAFIFNSKGEVLLIRSPKWEKGKIWLVSGGHIEFGESIESALVREVKEEVGLDVKYEGVITFFEDIFPRSFHTKKHFIYLECKAKALNEDKLKIDGKEIIEAKWWKISDALKLNNKQLHFLVKKVLKSLN